MQTKNVIVLFAAVAAVAVGVLLLLRSRAAAAPAQLPAAAVNTQAGAPQANYSGFVATNAQASGGGGGFKDTVTSGYASIMGAGASTACEAYTRGAAPPLCALAGDLQSKFSKVLANTTVNVGQKILSGAKSAFDRINPF